MSLFVYKDDALSLIIQERTLQSDSYLYETIVDYETGLLCNPFDPDDIAKKIVWVLSNKEKAKKIGEMGRKFVVDKLDLQKIVNQNYDFFQSIMFEKE